MVRSDKRFCGVIQGRVLPVLWNRSQPLEYRSTRKSGAIWAIRPRKSTRGFGTVTNPQLSRVTLFLLVP